MMKPTKDSVESFKGIIIDENLIAVKTRDVKELVEGDKFVINVEGTAYRYIVSSKQKIEGYAIPMFRVRYKCISHPYMSLTEYTSI